MNLIKEKINNMMVELSSVSGMRMTYRNVIKVDKKKKKRILKECIELEKAILFLDFLIENNHNNIVELFEKTISIGLKDVFNEAYDFKFLFSKRGTKIVCDFGLKTDEYDSYLPLKMCQGKSVQDIISLIMKLVYIKIDKNIPDIIVMDEPLSGLSIEKQVIIGKYLDEVLGKFDVQKILVTHSERIAARADKRIDL